MRSGPTLSPLDARQQKVIAFRVGSREFSVTVAAVREIRGWTTATTLPKVPRYIRGVINLRGAVLPIVDFAIRLGLPAAEPTARNVIIVVQIEQKQIGLLVDAVSDIITLDQTCIQPAPDIASETVSAFVRGLIAVEGRMISLIALDNVLPPESGAPG